ncbi:MAG: hypothetical protein WCK08_08925 [Betaproteobacteria bacterium]
MNASRQLLQVLMYALMTALSACSGTGGGGGAGYTITGVAASGAALAKGVLDVNCQQGSGSAMTGTDGSYSITITGGQGPCILRATQPATGLVLHSLVEEGATTANITPVTELILAHLFGRAPSQVFAQFGPEQARKITPEALALSKAVVLEATKDWRLATPTQEEFDPFKAPLKAATTQSVGNNFDQTLDTLMASIIAADTSLPALAQSLMSASQSSATEMARAVLSASQDTLEGCPIARSGPLWLIDFSNAFDGPRSFRIDYAQGALVQQGEQGQELARSPITASSTEYCAFGAQLDGQSAEFRVSGSGLMLWSSPRYAGLAVPRQSLLNLAPLQYQATQASLAYLVASLGEQTVTQAIANRFEWNAGRLSTYGCDFSDPAQPACSTDLSQSFSLTCLPTPGADAREAPLQCRRSDNAAAGLSIGFVSGSSAITIVAVKDFPVGAPGAQALARGVMIISRASAQALPELGLSQAPRSQWFIGLDAGGQPVSGYAGASEVVALNPGERQYTRQEDGQRWLSLLDQPALGLLYSRPANASGYRLSMACAEGWSFGIDATGPAPVPRALVRTRLRP